ncbi:MAG TPA: hypothetical protein PKU97_24645, partial [Kofleriaceae bacterium]|nr:hypothetical protein [Kofleriaceae bacterium]
MSSEWDDLFLKAVFEIAFFPDEAQPHVALAWYQDRSYVQQLVDAVAELPLFTEFRLAGPEGEQRAFSGVEEAKRLVATGRDDTVYLQDGPDDERLAMVRIEPSAGSLTLKIWCGGAVLQRHRATLFDQLTQVISRIRAQLAGKAGVQFGFAYPVHDLELGFTYPRPRPPRRHPSIQIYSVMDFFDLTFHRSGHEDAGLDGVRALLGSERPAFVTQSEAEGLVV